MYYNLTTEQRYILTLSDTMLKEGYTVDEVIEFLQCEDMDQVECILGTLTLTESADVDHPDLELVVERLQSLGRIGSWLTRQAGKLKGLFGRGASKAKVNLKPTTTKVKSTNPRGPGKKFRGKKVTGDVKPTLGDKVKKGLKISALAGGAALLGGAVIDNVMNSDDEPPIRPDTSSTTTGGGDGTGNNGDDKKPTKAYGWWKRSHSDSPYSSTDHFKNIRRKKSDSPLASDDSKK